MPPGGATKDENGFERKLLLAAGEEIGTYLVLRARTVDRSSGLAHHELSPLLQGARRVECFS